MPRSQDILSRCPPAPPRTKQTAQRGHIIARFCPRDKAHRWIPSCYVGYHARGSRSHHGRIDGLSLSCKAIHPPVLLTSRTRLDCPERVVGKAIGNRATRPPIRV